MTATNTAQLPVGERQGIIQWAGQHFGVDAGKVLATMKATCFRGDGKTEVTDAEVAALLIVAREHGLNPFLKEIYAFPAKGGGIVPIVGIDGWISIVNKHPQYNGVQFVYDQAEKPAWIQCHMYRKDRTHPIEVRELMSECRRNTGPWESHPTRMLRHKAYIQCARVAFGFAGIYDPDEGEAIATAGHVIDHEPHPAKPQRGATGLKHALGAPAADATRTTDGAEATTTGETLKAIVETRPAKEKPIGTVEQRDDVVRQMKGCADVEVLALARDLANEYAWTAPDQQVIDDAYTARRKELGA